MTTPIDHPISWDALIEFANNKKAEEKRTGRPAKLTQDQVSSILKLIPSPEPKFDDNNWVSRLNEYYQKKGQPIQWPDAKSTNVNIHGVDQLAWHCHIVLPSSTKKFPCVGYGCGPDGNAPAFSSKMKAKQFAAWQAWRFTNREPPDQNLGEKRAAILTGGVSLETPPPTKIKVEEMAASQREQTTVMKRQQANELARQLNHGDWEVNLQQVAPDTYTGRAVFQNDGRVPDSVAVVENVVGKQQAEENITDLVLEWLQDEMRIAEERTQRLYG